MFASEDVSELAEELAAQAAHVDAGLCRLLELAAECERRLDWGGDGVTFARWLAWRCSLSPGQARAYERVAKRLGELPLIHEAFARGELSFGKVSVLVAVADPDTEAELLELAAVMTASQLGRAVGAYRRLARAEAAAQEERAYLRSCWDDDGSLRLQGRLAGADGALFLQSLEAGRDALWEQARAGRQADPAPTAAVGPRRPSSAQALVAMAELALTAAGGDRWNAERYQVLVHVDAATLAADQPGRCELADGPALAAETARRLSCDGSIVALLEHDRKPLRLGRKRRTVSPPPRRALTARDRGCRFPGRDNTRFLDGHHLRHWSRGGTTDIDNLLLHCRRHHRLVHEHGYTIRHDPDSQPRFENQHEIPVENIPRPPPPPAPAGCTSTTTGTASAATPAPAGPAPATGWTSPSPSTRSARS